jgi:hypothetical protein
MRLRFWREKKRWVVGPEIPKAYVELLTFTDPWAPYKRKAWFLFLVGMSVIVALDVPGLFFTNPYTHVTEGPAAYLGVLGAVVIGLNGLGFMWWYQHKKDSDVMQFEFAAFNLRVRKSLRVGFHALLGTIERIPDGLANDLKAILDNKADELRQANKVRPLETVDIPAGTINVTGGGSPAPLAKIDQPNPAQVKLNLFYLPTPGCPIPGIGLLSPAATPEDLKCPLPGEWIWEGWNRHAKGEVFDLAVIGEWQYRLQGQSTISVIPICAAAGTYYDFTFALSRAFTPPILNTAVIELAKQNIQAHHLGLEAVGQVQVYRDALAVREAMETPIRDQVTNIVGGILELLEAEGKLDPVAVKPRTHYAAYIGATIVLTVLGLGVYLATHGWKLF